MKETLYRICSIVFTTTVILFMLMGAAIVLVQLTGVVLGNGELVLGVSKAIKNISTETAALCGFAGFFAAYLKPKKKAA